MTLESAREDTATYFLFLQKSHDSCALSLRRLGGGREFPTIVKDSVQIQRQEQFSHSFQDHRGQCVDGTARVA